MCEVTKVKDIIKRRADTTEETTQQILATELRNISEGAAANLPAIYMLRRNRHTRHTRQYRDVPHNPIRREDIPELPPAYRLTVNVDPFLAFDSGAGDHDYSFWSIRSTGMQTVPSRLVLRYFSYCIWYMDSVMSEYFLVSSICCLPKTRTPTTDFWKHYSAK